MPLRRTVPLPARPAEVPAQRDGTAGYAVQPGAPGSRHSARGSPEPQGLNAKEGLWALENQLRNTESLSPARTRFTTASGLDYREQPGRRAMKNKGRAGGCGQEAAAAPRCSLGRVPCTGIPVMPLTDAQVPANVSGKSSAWPTHARHLRGSARRARQTGQGWGKAPCRAGGSLHWSRGSLWGHGCSSPMCPGLHCRAGTAQRHGHRPALPACWSSLRLSARFRLDMPFSMEKITVVNGKPGRDRAAAHPTALLVLTKSIYI